MSEKDLTLDELTDEEIDKALGELSSAGEPLGEPLPPDNINEVMERQYDEGAMKGLSMTKQHETPQADGGKQ